MCTPYGACREGGGKSFGSLSGERLYLKIKHKDSGGYSSSIEHVSYMCQALGSIPSAKK